MHQISLAYELVTRAQTTQALHVIITETIHEAERLKTECEFFLGKQDTLPVFLFPDWETLPYDTLTPHQDILSTRLKTLYTLPRLKKGIVFVAVNTLMHLLPPQTHIEKHSLVIKVGDKYALDEARDNFTRHGYQHVSQVLTPGEFAVRGGIIDIFPMGSPSPFRIELFDDEIDSLRAFDAETQRTTESLKQILLLPAREFDQDEASIAAFKDRWHSHFPEIGTDAALYRDIVKGLAPAGIQYYLRLFFDRLVSFWDYLPKGCRIHTLGQVDTHAQRFWQEAQERFLQLSWDKSRPRLAVEEWLYPWPTLLAQAPSPLAPVQADAANLPPLNSLAELIDFIKTEKRPTLLCAYSPGRRELLRERLVAHGLKAVIYDDWAEMKPHLDLKSSSAQLAIVTAPLEHGGYLKVHNLLILTEQDWQGERVPQRKIHTKRAVDAEHVIRNLSELTPGTPVVHVEHGIGRYLGLETLTVGQTLGEYVLLEYDGGDKLYVPVTSLHLISRYSGVDNAAAPLHHLGGKDWQKSKQNAVKKIQDVAAELLQLYAAREAQAGLTCNLPKDYEAFADEFRFEETEDQKKAIVAVLTDLQGTRPMDRLVCGDVGFGKTEVALRAAFVAAMNGLQTAILVPTTLLAEQHFETFRDRFANWPIQVEMLSRFRSKKEQEAIGHKLQDGSVDIVIGTHALLSPNLRFKKLGLLVIDEEHRFGVKQKEKIKSLRHDVHVLTLTATPIPRTLHMAFSGMRELSLIGTPPEGRLSVKTFIHEHSEALMREAILREILRGGQVYYVYNDVSKMAQRAEKLKTLVPEANIQLAHGQLPEKQLERIMADFYHQAFNVLLCSTIIESGIDIPTANTILIERADKFGLAQLHQLRGRVGRSHHQAYAYLLTPQADILTSDAEKRLSAFASLEDLGIGFSLATHDLEIRGAGELLGQEQSGQIQAVGYSLYKELLERAVMSLKNGEVLSSELPSFLPTEIQLQIPALIPESYLPDVHSRMVLYRRIAAAKSADELDALHIEMIDRFGLLPVPAKHLMQVSALKVQAQAVGIHKIDLGPTGGKITFLAKNNIEPIKLIQLVQTQSKTYQFKGPTALLIKKPLPEAAERLQYAEEFLKLISV